MSVSIWIVVGVYLAGSVVLGLTDHECRGALLMMAIFPLFPVMFVAAWAAKWLDSYPLYKDDASRSVAVWADRRDHTLRVWSIGKRFIVLTGRQSSGVRAEGGEAE